MSLPLRKKLKFQSDAQDALSLRSHFFECCFPSLSSHMSPDISDPFLVNHEEVIEPHDQLSQIQRDEQFQLPSLVARSMQDDNTFQNFDRPMSIPSIDPLPQGSAESWLPIFSASLLSFSSSSPIPSIEAPLVSDPFLLRPHPLEQNNLWGLGEQLIKPLRNLITSLLPLEDYRIPLVIRPDYEYKTGELFAIQLGNWGLDILDRYDSILMMQSLYDLTFYMPSPVGLFGQGEINMDSHCMLRSLNDDTMNGFKVLYIPIQSDSGLVQKAISTMDAYLRNITMLVLHKYDTRFHDRMFIFDFRRSVNRVADINDTISALENYEEDKNLDRLLLAYSNDAEHTVVLVEALISVNSSQMPLFAENIDYSIVRWSFTLTDEENDQQDAVLQAARVYRLSNGALDRLTLCPNLRSLIYRSNIPPEGGFEHFGISFLHWEPVGLVSGRISLEELPNLKCLEVDGIYGNFTGELFLGKNINLRRLHLRKIDVWDIDIGYYPLQLDEFYVSEFYGNFRNVDNIRIKLLDIGGFLHDKYVLVFTELAEKINFQYISQNIVSKNLPGIFANIELKYPESGIFIEKELSSLLLLASSDNHYRLRIMDIEMCRLTISTKMFPLLSRLTVRDCTLTMLSDELAIDIINDDENKFLELVYVEFFKCNLMAAPSVSKRDKSYVKRRAQYLFQAPKLQSLTLYNVLGLDCIFFNNTSSPLLKKFVWHGRDYDSLPFDFRHTDVPIFPDLRELTLERVSGCHVNSGYLANRLCIENVFALRLLNSSFINHLDKMTFACRIAEFSVPVAKQALKIRQEGSHSFTSLDTAELLELVSNHIPKVELLRIGRHDVDPSGILKEVFAVYDLFLL